MSLNSEIQILLNDRGRNYGVLEEKMRFYADGHHFTISNERRYKKRYLRIEYIRAENWLTNPKSNFQTKEQRLVGTPIRQSGGKSIKYRLNG